MEIIANVNKHFLVYSQCIDFLAWLINLLSYFLMDVFWNFRKSYKTYVSAKKIFPKRCFDGCLPYLKTQSLETHSIHIAKYDCVFILFSLQKDYKSVPFFT